MVNRARANGSSSLSADTGLFEGPAGPKGRQFLVSVTMKELLEAAAEVAPEGGAPEEAAPLEEEQG